MKYLGSKARHADEILAIVLAKRQPGQTYVEPFVGGANVICRVPQAQGPRLGADLNKYMVALHTALANGWQPPRDMTKAEYAAMKKHPDKFDPALVAFAATGCSFGSMWFGEWVKPEKEGDSRCRQSADSCLRDAPGLAGATFVHASYADLTIPPRSLVYCDPPYVGTTGYDGTKKKSIPVGEVQDQWRAAPFWRWADALVDAGHIVFVSEYSGPKAGEVYKIPDSDDRKGAAAALRALQADPKSPLVDIEALQQRLRECDAIKAAEAQALADRWKVVWSKEVVSEFSADRSTEAKRETEKLFHREA